MTDLAPEGEPFLEVAQAIAAHLARTAVWGHDDCCTWVGSATELVQGAYRAVQKACATDLYSGTAGVALYLSRLLARHPDPLLADTLEGAVNHVLRSPAGEHTTNYGYFSGALGLAATLIEIGEEHHRPDWVSAGRERLAQVCAQPVQPHEVDVIVGVAGAIPVLLRLLARYPDAHLHEAAVRAGDFLVQLATKQPTAWSWAAIPGQPALTGYSHGAAGIALALLELYRATNNPTYHTSALLGFNFERLHYNPQLQNWPDLRDFNPATGPVYGEAWCHGAPGIALSRLRAWQLTGDDTFRQEAELALNTTHRGIYNLVTTAGAQPNLSLCHGLAGNADVLLEGSQLLGNPLYRQVAEAAGHYGLENFHRPGLSWPSGVNDPSGLTPGRAEAPGLMMGLAGTGLFYLRLAHPGQVASALLL